MKILLDEKEYELGELTLNQWNKVKEINMSEQNLTDPEFISLMTDIPLDEIKQATIPQIGFVAKVLESWFTNTTQQKPVRQMVEYKGEMLGLTQPSQMTWGEWTDLEVLFSQEKKNLQHICAILYRPCETYSIKTLERTIVKYNYDECLERSKDMGDFPMSVIYSSVFFFMNYAKLLTNKQKDSMEVKKKKMTELLRRTKGHTKKN